MEVVPAGTHDLLENVCPHESARCALEYARLERIHKKMPGGETSRTAANWVTISSPADTVKTGPRHLTLRRRGVAPAYPDKAAFCDAIVGRLILNEEGLSLESASRDNLRIAALNIERATFYRDCVEILHSERKCTLIRCDDLKLLDVFFQVYY